MAAGFGYKPTKYRFVCDYKDGCWDLGVFTENPNIVLNEAAGVLQYAQTAFEGLKAYRRVDGKISLFRLEDHGKRLNDSIKAIGIPEFPVDRFAEAVKEVVRLNQEEIPNVGDELYIRPTVFSTQPILGIKIAQEHQLRIFCSPVQGHFCGEGQPVKLCTSKYDRAAPQGTGHLKLGLNYAMSMQSIAEAKNQGFDDCLYLDPSYHMFVEEASGANILFFDKNRNLIVPESSTILPSITRDSLITLCKRDSLFNVVERKVLVSELGEMTECCLCGTAAIVTPVACIVDDVSSFSTFTFDAETEGIGYGTRMLKDLIQDLKFGIRPDTEGWVCVI